MYALEKMAALLEVGATVVTIRDLDGQLVDQAGLESEAASQT
jgi:hypothetical protein